MKDSLLIEENALNIFTDGSMLNSPRVGGVGICYVWIGESGHEQIYNPPELGYAGASSNQMELQACIIALRTSEKDDSIPKFPKINIYTDSQYVVDNIGNAIYRWPNKKWRRTSGAPVLNVKFWKELVREVKRLDKVKVKVRFNWEKGHARSEHNKNADRLAKNSAKAPFNKPITYVSVRRKISRESVDPGSVEMESQRIIIHIITSEYLPQREWRHMYEVVSKRSEYHGKVDWIFSDKLLRDGHCYIVKVNNDMGYPQVKEIIREILPKEK